MAPRAGHERPYPWPSTAPGPGRRGAENRPDHGPDPQARLANPRTASAGEGISQLAGKPRSRGEPRLPSNLMLKQYFSRLASAL
ncbi:hypothetical protein EMIT0324P_20438 [Pseudomonas chlororaphis]